MTRSTRKWLEGLLRALFSGMAGVLGVAFVDPVDFNFNELGNVAMVAAIFGAVQLVQYLSQKPLPDEESQ